MIGQIISHYRVLEKLGDGGMGVVWAADDTRLSRRVALKFLPDELERDELALERLKREAQAASSLNHPRICTIHDIDSDNGRHFIVMEFLDGQTLKNRIQKSSLQISEMVELATQIADALEAAHAQGIMHRDIKPANIFITERGLVKVLDFGLAKFTRTGRMRVANAHRSLGGAPSSPTEEVLTGSGIALGTMPYMSPEQVRGDDLDARTDLFSFGAVLYEMATRRMAFQGNTLEILTDKILNREPVNPSQINPALPPVLEAIIRKGLEKDRSLRYQTASDLLADLQRLKRDIDSGRLRDSDSALPAPRATKAIDSLAILPLANETKDPDTDYLSDGITETLINNLSQLPKLRVLPRSTVFRYKGREMDPTALSRELGVRAVLTGRVVHRGDVLTIKVELVDGARQAHLWGGNFSRKLDDIFAVQEEIAQQISEHMRLHLSPQEKKKLAARDTGNREAYQAFLRALYFWNKWTPASSWRAMEYCRLAIEKDPAYAPAHAVMADCYTSLAVFGVLPAKEAFPQAKAAAAKAVKMGPSLSDAHLAVGLISLYFDWDWVVAEKHLRRAVELSPHSARAHYGLSLWLLVQQRHVEAIQEADNALELDPLSLPMNFNVGYLNYFAGNNDRAIGQFEKILEMDPSFMLASLILSPAYLRKGMLPEALATVEKALPQSRNWSSLRAMLAVVHAGSGRGREALEILEELKKEGVSFPLLSYWAAIISNALQDKEQTLDWLEKACEERIGLLVLLKVASGFRNLTQEPRYQAILKRIGLP
jgi:serine/threonine protein kinase/tetratricopeptide (TPR) repeat protein